MFNLKCPLVDYYIKIKEEEKENAKNVVKGVLGTLLAQQEEAYTLEVK